MIVILVLLSFVYALIHAQCLIYCDWGWDFSVTVILSPHQHQGWNNNNKYSNLLTRNETNNDGYVFVVLCFLTNGNTKHCVLHRAFSSNESVLYINYGQGYLWELLGGSLVNKCLFIIQCMLTK